MRGFVRRPLTRGSFPGDAPIRSIDREHFVGVHDAGRNAAAGLVRFGGRHASRDGGQEVEAIAPNHRRRRAAPRNPLLPPDVARFAPRERWLGVAGNACPFRAAPPRPVLLGIRGRRHRQQLSCGHCRHRHRRSPPQSAHAGHYKTSRRAAGPPVAVARLTVALIPNEFGTAVAHTAIVAEPDRSIHPDRADTELTEEAKRDTVIRLAFGGDADKFREFCDVVRDGIPLGVGAVLRGSAVTGQRWKDGAAFDADGPGTSDLDLTLVGGDDVMALYGLSGFFIPNVHSRPLSDEAPDIAPALVPLRERLMQMVGRPVNI